MSPETPPEPEDRVPQGVQWLALLAGLVLGVMGWTSAAKDLDLLRKLTRIDQVYRPMPARFLEVSVRGDSSGNKDEFHPQVLYEYFILGKNVWGWRFSHEESPQARAIWEERLRRYHVGDTVTAYVNPDDPKDSLIEKKRDGSLFRLALKIALGAAFFLAGVVLSAIPVWIWAKKALKK